MSQKGQRHSGGLRPWVTHTGIRDIKEHCDTEISEEQRVEKASHAW